MSAYAARMPTTRSTNWGKAFAIIAIVEAITWVLLLIGIYLKRVSDTTEVGVQVFGPLHGVAFILYLFVTATAAVRLRWSPGLTAMALLASIPPLFTLVFEVWARRRGHLERPAA